MQQLRGLLQDRSLETTGRKKQLVARLLAYPPAAEDARGAARGTSTPVLADENAECAASDPDSSVHADENAGDEASGTSTPVLVPQGVVERVHADSSSSYSSSSSSSSSSYTDEESHYLAPLGRP